MAASRATSRLAPGLLRPSARGMRLRSTALPREVSAIALLIPRRAVSTETSSSSGSPSNFPPPGYNHDKAKKSSAQEATTAEGQPGPLQRAATKHDIPKAEIREDLKFSKTAPTSHPKTPATEAVSLAELAAEKAATEKGNVGKEAAEKKEEDRKKLTVWQKVKKEAEHYWDGTKLLATEVKISSRLALRMAAGYELSRREHRQLQRTVQDLGRLVPFSVFVIVPFAELLLPVALRLFPNLLPSTYEGRAAKDAKATNLRATRKEVSSFLRQTLRETGLPVPTNESKRQEFVDFFKKIRSSGENPSPEDVIRICKWFKDDLTLDNLSRPQLVGICRYMNLNAIGPDTLLRYQIRHHMRQLKRDDRAISYEGVASLSVTELQTAAASRGLRTHGVSPGRLRDDLQMWLDLRLKYGIPSTLLVLSNAFMYAQGKETEFKTQVESLQSVLSSIPEELFHEIELEVHNAEGAATNKQRLEVLKEQQDLIEEEREQSAASTETGRSTPKDTENIDEGEAEAETELSKNDTEGVVDTDSAKEAAGKEDAEPRSAKEAK